MNGNSCGCCEGIEVLTPRSTANRPGLGSLAYRVGTHATFLETMKARLSAIWLEAPVEGSSQAMRRIYPLRGVLTSREANDPAIAFLDAWATVADVLTFYQERIANEGYLLTATERRSILDLARLVGYRLRPGVASSVFLAFELDKGYEVEIPAGTRAQSLPGPGELPQSFETAEPLSARFEWNGLKPRLTRPQYITYDNAKNNLGVVYFEGISTNLRANSRLLFFFRSNPSICYCLRHVATVEPDAPKNRTKVVLLPPEGKGWVKAAEIEGAISVMANLPKLSGTTAEKIFDILQPIRDVLEGSKSPSELYEAVREAVLRLEGVDIVLPGDSNAPLRSWNAELVQTLAGLPEERPARTLSGRFEPISGLAPEDVGTPAVIKFDEIVNRLALRPPVQLAHSDQLSRPVETIWSPSSINARKMLTSLDSRLSEKALYRALPTAQLGTPQDLVGVDTLRAQAAPFGHNAPLKPVYNEDGLIAGHEEWPLYGVLGIDLRLLSSQSEELKDTFPAFAIEATKLPGWRIGVSVQRPTGTASTVAPISIGRQSLEQVIDVGAEKVVLAAGPLVRFVDGRFGSNGDKLKVHIDGVPSELEFHNPEVLPEVTPYISLTPGRYTFRFATTEKQPDNSHAIGFELEKGRAYSIVAAKSGADFVPVLLPGGIIRPADNRVQFRVAHLDAETTKAVTVRVKDTGGKDVAVFNNIEYPKGYSYQQAPIQDSASKYTVEVLSSDSVTPLYTEETSLQGGSSCDIYLLNLETEVVKLVPYYTSTVQNLGLTFDFQNPARSFWIHAERAQDVTLQLLDDLSPKRRTWKTAIGETFRDQFDGRKMFVDLKAQPPRLAHLAYEEVLPLPAEQRKILALDQTNDQIIPGSWVVIELPSRANPAETETLIQQVTDVATVSKANYGLTGRCTQLTLNGDWLDKNDIYLSVCRGTQVYAQNERLALADEPITDAVCGGGAGPAVSGVKELELDGLYRGLETGRWVIVSGERTDIPGVTSLHDSELAMIAAIREGMQVDRPGDTLHTTITFDKPLAYCYKRDTVTIYGNVAKATHGETRTEVLGSGNGAQARQRFALKQKPLTHVAAATARGTDSTLEVRVDDVRWREANDLFVLGPNDRQYITEVDDEENTSVLFGDGLNGARLPTGMENVKAVYRTGIGGPGNVAAEQISLLATRPLGVKGVINPKAASGGADREDRDQARANAPLGVLALDRLVSVQDYADFARTFAGIGKAHATRLSNGRQQVVHLTIAGADDIPIDKTSDLYRNLRQALHKYGDPLQPVEIDLRELVLLIIKARVRVLADYAWETVAPKIRIAMQEAFGFQRRELGQDVLASEVIAAIQAVPGVAYVDLDLLGSVSESDAKTSQRLAEKLNSLINAPRCVEDDTKENCQPQPRIEARIATFDRDAQAFKPAQLALLSAQMAETLLLEVIP